MASTSNKNEEEMSLCLCGRYIRGNRIIWSSGSRVLKRYTLQSSVIMACWCNLGALSEPHLCVLQVGTLTVYGVGGEVVSIPLPRTITSIWLLPCGLLLQKAADVNYPAFGPYSASSTSLNACDFPHLKRELGYSPQHNLHADHTIKGDATKLSSHLILKDPLEEPQDQKRFNEQLTTEQEALFGSRPTPSKSIGPKKVAGSRANGGTPNGTPRRLSMNTHQSSTNGGRSTSKEWKRDNTRPVAPVNYVAIQKEDAASHVSNTESFPASP